MTSLLYFFKSLADFSIFYAALWVFYLIFFTPSAIFSVTTWPYLFNYFTPFANFSLTTCPYRFISLIADSPYFLSSFKVFDAALTTFLPSLFTFSADLETAPAMFWVYFFKLYPSLAVSFNKFSPCAFTPGVNFCAFWLMRAIGGTTTAFGCI